MCTSVLTLRRQTFLLICLGITLLPWSKPLQAEEALKAYKEAATLPNSSSLVKTIFGNPINVYSISHNFPQKDGPIPRFLIEGGLHGNELLTSEFVLWLAKRFADSDSMLNLLNSGKVEIDFLPYANPDGTLFFTRNNGNKVNLNRNFSVLWGITKENPGKSAFSEAETRAIQNLFARRQYTGAVDVHGYVNYVVIPTSPTEGKNVVKAAKKRDVERYERWAQMMKKSVATHLPGYDIKTGGGLGDGGAFEDYAFWSQGVPAVCLELFSADRMLVTSLASEIAKLLNPTTLSKQQTDMFLIYENFIYETFKNALELKNLKADEKKIVAK